MKWYYFSCVHRSKGVQFYSDGNIAGTCCRRWLFRSWTCWCFPFVMSVDSLNLFIDAIIMEVWVHRTTPICTLSASAPVYRTTGTCRRSMSQSSPWWSILWAGLKVLNSVHHDVGSSFILVSVYNFKTDMWKHVKAVPFSDCHKW